MILHNEKFQNNQIEDILFNILLYILLINQPVYDKICFILKYNSIHYYVNTNIFQYFIENIFKNGLNNILFKNIFLNHCSSS